MGRVTVTLQSDNDGSTRHKRKARRLFQEGFAHQQKREWAAAADCYTKAIAAADDDEFQCRANRGMCMHFLGRPEEALRDYARAMRVGTPDLRQLITVNRGVLLGALGRYDEALADFATDSSPESLLNAAYIHLARGNLEHGLELYRQRPTVKRWRAPLHRLEDLAGKSVVVVHEQGYGDSIQMARYLPQLTAVAKSVHWTTRTALVPLLQQIPGITVSDGSDAKAAGLMLRNDAFVLVMDLWQTCGLGIDGRPYLHAGPALTAYMQDRLPRSPRIGLSWRGRQDHANDHNRSMPLDALAPVLQLTGRKFISLQMDMRPEERVIFDGGALVRDFADSAALMRCLDAVVTVDTATAHLAGALGIPTAILLPYAPDWRWGISGDTTPWYDSVRLFRQPAFGAWGPAAAAAADWLVRCGV